VTCTSYIFVFGGCLEAFIHYSNQPRCLIKEKEYTIGVTSSFIYSPILFALVLMFLFSIPEILLTHSMVQSPS